MKCVKELLPFDRPREKMKKNGAQALSNIELLAVIIGSGMQGRDVFAVSKDILKLAQTLLEKKHNKTFTCYMDKFIPMWRSYKKELNDYLAPYCHD
jgi:DNA repair protein RadC